MFKFDIKEDNEFIGAGTHFWCSGCLSARPVDDRSPDPRYCQGCYEVLNKKEERSQSPEKWVKNGMMNIVDGQGYGLTPKLQTVCIGPVDDEGNSLEDVYKPIEKPSVEDIDVSKPPDMETLGANDSHEQKEGSFDTSKQGGRPRKMGTDVSRMTKWRRKKEIQGVLL